MRQLRTIFKMPIIFILFLSWAFTSNVYGQETHVIEPSVLQVSYHVVQENNQDDCVLRCGRNVSSFFRIESLTSDSLGSNEETVVPYIQKLIQDLDNHVPRPKSSVRGYLYRNYKPGKWSTYTSAGGTGYVIDEDIEEQPWNIREDTTATILGYTCYYAQANFRGRTWEVWFTTDIPIDQGPWKLCGLPGLILYAKSDGLMSFEASSIKTISLPPVKFYNFWKKKFESIDRKDFLRVSRDKSLYPVNVTFMPQMELE